MDDHERAIRRLRLDERERREELEAAEAELDRSTRRVVDVCTDAGRRGASVLVEVAGHDLRGSVVHTGAEVIVIGSVDARTLVVVDAIEGIEVDPGPSTDHGPSTTGHPATLLAFLRGLAIDDGGTEVELFRRSTGPIRGRLRAVTADHVAVERRSGVERVVPLGAVVAVSAVGGLGGVRVR